MGINFRFQPFEKIDIWKTRIEIIPFLVVYGNNIDTVVVSSFSLVFVCNFGRNWIITLTVSLKIIKNVIVMTKMAIFGSKTFVQSKKSSS